MLPGAGDMPGQDIASLSVIRCLLRENKSMRRKQENRYKTSIEKELKLAERQEDTLRRAAVKKEVPRWRQALDE